jgi:hypothetical protein
MPESGDDTIMHMLIFWTVNNPNNWIGSADWELGVHKLKLLVMSNTYVGMDLEYDLVLTLEDPAKVPKLEVHEDDKNIEGEGPTLYSLLQPTVENERDSDFEGEEEEEDEEPPEKTSGGETDVE